MAGSVSINQVKHRFIGEKDVEFEISCERVWGDIAVILSIYQGERKDGTFTPSGQIQFAEEEDGEMYTNLSGSTLDELCTLWHISPDEELWTITSEDTPASQAG